jgi:hypothetical protein
LETLEILEHGVDPKAPKQRDRVLGVLVEVGVENAWYMK